MTQVTGEAAEEWPQHGEPSESENDRSMRNPNPIGAHPCADNVCNVVAGRKRKNMNRPLYTRRRSNKTMKSHALDGAGPKRRTMAKQGLAPRPKMMKHIAAVSKKKLPATLEEGILPQLQLQEDQGSVEEVEPRDAVGNGDAEDDNSASEHAVAQDVADVIPPPPAAVQDDPMVGEEADDPIEYEDGFIPWVDLDLPDVDRRSSALQLPSSVIEDSPGSPEN